MYIKQLKIPTAEGIKLSGDLNVPVHSKGFVIFCNGRGSSRFSERNMQIAATLHKNKIATLLTDLLTEQEDKIFEESFDVDLLSERLTWITTYAKYLQQLKNLPIGYFGAGNGSSVVMHAASRLQSTIKTLVCSTGGHEIAQDNLRSIKSPCLLIEEGLDDNIRRQNYSSYIMLNCEKQYFEATSGLFESQGKTDETALLSVDWLNRYLVNNPIAAVIL
jgi:hypothetical protein